jgi:hypothetical protein
MAFLNAHIASFIFFDSHKETGGIRPDQAIDPLGLPKQEQSSTKMKKDNRVMKPT